MGIISNHGIFATLSKRFKSLTNVGGGGHYGTKLNKMSKCFQMIAVGI
jgi:hypothetical protein